MRAGRKQRYRSTTKAILQFTLYRERLPLSSTSALLLMTSTPRMPRRVSAAAATALRTASLKEFGELPTTSVIRTTALGTWSCCSDITPPDVTGATSRLGSSCSGPPHRAPRANGCSRLLAPAGATSPHPDAVLTEQLVRPVGRS